MVVKLELTDHWHCLPEHEVVRSNFHPLKKHWNNDQNNMQIIMEMQHKTTHIFAECVKGFTIQGIEQGVLLHQTTRDKHYLQSSQTNNNKTV